MQPWLTCILILLIVDKKAFYRAVDTVQYASLNHVLVHRIKLCFSLLVFSIQRKTLAISHLRL